MIVRRLHRVGVSFGYVTATLLERVEGVEVLNHRVVGSIIRLDLLLSMRGTRVERRGSLLRKIVSSSSFLFDSKPEIQQSLTWNTDIGHLSRVIQHIQIFP